MLRLEIEGAWEPQDFIEILQAVESMYYKLSIHNLYRPKRPLFYIGELDYFHRIALSERSYEFALDTMNGRLLERARYESSSFERLKVRRMEYASPGAIDLLGIGIVCEAIANSIGRMVVYYNEAHLRRERDEQATLETERKRIEVEKERETLRALKIENGRNALKLMDDYGEDYEVLIPLLVRDQDALSQRIAEGKLISAKTSKNDAS